MEIFSTRPAVAWGRRGGLRAALGREREKKKTRFLFTEAKGSGKKIIFLCLKKKNLYFDFKILSKKFYFKKLKKIKSNKNQRGCFLKI